MHCLVANPRVTSLTKSLVMPLGTQIQVVRLNSIGGLLVLEKESYMAIVPSAETLSLSLSISLYLSHSSAETRFSNALCFFWEERLMPHARQRGFALAIHKAIIMGQRSKTGSLYEAAIRCTGSPQTGGCITLAENVRARVTSPTSTCQNCVQWCTWKCANMLQAKYVS